MCSPLPSSGMRGRAQRGAAHGPGPPACGFRARPPGSWARADSTHTHTHTLTECCSRYNYRSSHLTADSECVAHVVLRAPQGPVCLCGWWTRPCTRACVSVCSGAHVLRGCSGACGGQSRVRTCTHISSCALACLCICPCTRICVPTHTCLPVPTRPLSRQLSFHTRVCHLCTHASTLSPPVLWREVGACS